MRKIILYMFTTLDGFIAGPNGEFDPYEPSREEMDFANHVFGAADGFMSGRVVWEQFSEYWNAVDVDDESVDGAEAEFARIFRRLPKVVFSRTLEQADDDTTLIRGELAEKVRDLKNQPGGDFALVCGPELAGDLIASELLDECRIIIKPKVSGRGLALFGEIAREVPLRLLGTRIFASGAVMHHYEIVYR